MNINSFGVLSSCCFDLEKKRANLRFYLGSLAGTIGLTVAYVGSQLCYAVPLYISLPLLLEKFGFSFTRYGITF